MLEGSSHAQSTAEWAEKKKKVTGRGSRWAPGQLAEWVVVVTLRGCGGRQGRNARTVLCFRKDQTLAPVSSVALSVFIP